MKISYKQFLEIAKDLHAFDILECWDETAFNNYCAEFGDMTRERAVSLCAFCAGVTEEELKAAEYYSKW